MATEKYSTTHPFMILLVLFMILMTTAPAAGLTGEWHLLHSSIGISAMHMQLLPSNQVVIFDRIHSGPSNLSLPICPHHLNSSTDVNSCTAHSLLFDLPSSSIHPLSGLLTDPFCSSATLLPNSTFLQTGGFHDGDRTVRSLNPFHRNADWLEHPRSLSAPRWYATNHLLPDGRFIIVGGRREFTYEFFPPTSTGHLYPLPFLEQTRDGDAENNLYPFLHLLPDGNLFVFANTRSIIFNPTRNQILRELPKIPDSVPRNYPSSGSSVLLPIRPEPDVPHAAPAEVLICGGAAFGNFQAAVNGSFLPATRTCGRIVVTDPNPVWAMEDMPMPRVMGDMVILPTGEVLIVNGAGSGTAGWELGADPVTYPLLYRPSSPAGQRFVVLNNSPVPRMYHSSAVLDTYGRVLVGGSNPHVTYRFTDVTYPTELSLEAFHPPYLDSGLDGLRPRLVSDGLGTVGYGLTVTVRFSVAAFQPGAVVEAVVVAPSFQTHSVGMNQRMVVLEVQRVVPAPPGSRVPGGLTLEASVVAPPTPEIAPPGYYMMFVVHAGVPSQGVWVRFQEV